MMFVLDIGCGSNKSYIFRPYSKANIFLDIESPSKKIENFIVGDISHTPFRDTVFEEVYCSHVLEHINNPLDALRELIRICDGVLTVKVPHRFSKYAKKDPKHINFFNARWFEKTLEYLFIPSDNYEIKVEHKSLIHPYIPIITMPEEIIVRIHGFQAS